MWHAATVITLLFKLAAGALAPLCTDTLGTKMSHWLLKGEGK